MLNIYEGTPRDKEYLMTEFTRATRDSDDKSEAVRRGNKVKLKGGNVPSGRLSEGYMHIKNDKGEYINDSDPIRFPLLRKAVQLMLDGTHTPIEALYELNEEMGYRTKKTKRTGGNPLSESTWYKLLNDTKYCGQLVRSEGEFDSEFPKLMSQEEFGKIQIILGRKANRRRTKKDWAYTGEMNCGGCGGFITMEERWQIICPVCKVKFHKSAERISCISCGTIIEEMKNPTILHYTHLHCSKKKLSDGSQCKQPSLQVGDFEGQVHKLIEGLTIPEGFGQWAIKWLQQLHEIESEDRTKIKDNFLGLEKENQSQLDNLLDLRLKGFITDDEYDKKKKPLLMEKAELRQRVQGTNKRADEWMDLCERTFNFVTYAHIWFDKGDNVQKRAILHALGSDLRIDGKILSIQQHKPFMIANGMQERYGIKLETIGPEDSLAVITQKMGSEGATTSLLPG